MLVWETSDDWAAHHEREFAQIWRVLPKVVFSQTLNSVEGSARLATRELADEVKELKHQSDRDIAVGGATLAAALTRLELIDEYELFLYPIVVGGGTPFFAPESERFRLELLETRTFGGGVVYLRYLRS
jgi:dihydrofolate reductase